MKFHWWWVVLPLAVVWIAGWAVSVIVAVFFNPLYSDAERQKDLRQRLLAHCVINWILWPWLLPALLARRKLNRDMRTGKRPNWIMLSDGEESSRERTLADGTKFEAFVSSAGASSESSNISADYEDDSFTGEIRCRVRMIAPTPQSPTDWKRLEFTPRGPKPDPDDADAVDNYYLTSRYEISVQLPRGKYAVEFRVPDRSGKIEECSSVVLVVADYEDYNL